MSHMLRRTGSREVYICETVGSIISWPMVTNPNKRLPNPFGTVIHANFLLSTPGLRDHDISSKPSGGLLVPLQIVALDCVAAKGIARNSTSRSSVSGSYKLAPYMNASPFNPHLFSSNGQQQLHKGSIFSQLRAQRL